MNVEKKGDDECRVDSLSIRATHRHINLEWLFRMAMVALIQDDVIT